MKKEQYKIKEIVASKRKVGKAGEQNRQKNE